MTEPLYYSPSGLKRMWQAGLPVLVYGLFLVVLYNFGVADSILFVLFILMIVLIFVVPLCMRRPSSFGRAQMTNTYFVANGINLFINVPVLLRAYDDCIEFRVFFDSFIVPYERIIGEPTEVGRLVKSVRMIVDVPGVPRKLTIHAKKDARKAILIFLQSRAVTDTV